MFMQNAKFKFNIFEKFYNFTSNETTAGVNPIKMYTLGNIHERCQAKKGAGLQHFMIAGYKA